ncbi:hypothetical protein DL96DRAFT_1717381 [Flagelloscypha sp. PMI_526]|nr:hypothetical protein DL96DRAFT_1717381 [Flagelloscypha sp. PMI_526]
MPTSAVQCTSSIPLVIFYFSLTVTRQINAVPRETFASLVVFKTSHQAQLQTRHPWIMHFAIILHQRYLAVLAVAVPALPILRYEATGDISRLPRVFYEFLSTVSYILSSGARTWTQVLDSGVVWRLAGGKNELLFYSHLNLNITATFPKPPPPIPWRYIHSLSQLTSSLTSFHS